MNELYRVEYCFLKPHAFWGTKPKVYTSIRRAMQAKKECERFWAKVPFKPMFKPAFRIVHAK